MQGVNNRGNYELWGRGLYWGSVYYPIFYKSKPTLKKLKLSFKKEKKNPNDCCVKRKSTENIFSINHNLFGKLKLILYNLIQ